MLVRGNKLEPGTLFGRHSEGLLLKQRPKGVRHLGLEAAGHPLAFVGLFVFNVAALCPAERFVPRLFRRSRDTEVHRDRDVDRLHHRQGRRG